MSAFDDAAAGFFAAAADVFGDPALYTPPAGGIPIQCTAIIANRRSDDAEEFRGRPRVAGTQVDLKKAEIAAPAAGGVIAPGKIVNGSFVPDGRLFTIVGQPILDSAGIMWTCMTG